METSSSNNQDKSIVSNFVMVAASNILTILAGVISGFVLPMIMGEIDYGFYKIYSLYISYLGLFPLGFIDGIYLLYAGIKYNDINKEHFRYFTQFLIIFQTIIFVIITLVALCFINNDYGFIFLFVAISLIVNNLTGYYQIVSQITFRFKELALRNTYRSIFLIVSVLLLVVLLKVGAINVVTYKVYTTIYILLNMVLLLWYFVTYRDITFGHVKDKPNKKNIINLFKLGFPLLLSNLVGILILNVDRQFVSILFDTATFGKYAFAYNMLGLATTAIGALSTVLYPSLKTKTECELKKSYSNLNGFMLVIVSFMLLAYFPIVLIVNWILKGYISSLQYFLAIFPGLIFNSAVTIVMSNYYKSFGKVNQFFAISVVVLFMSVIANFIAYYSFKTPLAISVASVIVMVVWYLIADVILCKSFHTFNWMNFIYALLVSVCFYLCTILISNIYISCVVYLISFIGLTLIFERKVVFNFIKTRSLL